MPLFLNTFNASLWDGIEGRLSNKDDSVSLLLSVQKETLWNGKFSHLLQLLHTSLSKNTVLLDFLCALRSHLVQQKLIYLMSFCERNIRRSWPWT